MSAFFGSLDIIVWSIIRARGPLMKKKRSHTRFYSSSSSTWLKVKMVTWWGHVPLVRGVSVYCNLCNVDWAQIASVSLSDSITLTTSHQCYISFFDFLFALFALCPMYLLFPISCSCFPAYSYTYWHLIVFHFPFNNQDLDMRTCVCFSISVETCGTFGPCPPKTKRF